MQILMYTVLLDKRDVYLGKHIISLIRESAVHLRKQSACADWFAYGKTVWINLID